MFDEQSAFCSTPSGVAAAPAVANRVPKKRRELASPTATGTRRLRPSSGTTSRSITAGKSSGVQGSLDEAISTGPKGVAATLLTATSCSPRYSPTALCSAILASSDFTAVHPVQ